MKRSVLLATAAAATTLAWLRERDARLAAERFAAASFESLLFAIDANDVDTGRHARRVTSGALVLAEAAGLGAAERRDVERVALFHDIGKISAALFDVVHDTGHDGLSKADQEAITSHPRRGAEVLAPLAPFYPHLPEGVLSHHERWDGAGYPRGLAGLDIPITARIISIVDTYDAITHVRSYKEGKSRGTALQIIRQGRGSQFDPSLVDIYLLPAVQRRIRRAEREIGASIDSGRRHTRTEPDAPDITFRWREPGAVGQTERELRPRLATRSSSPED